MDEVAMERKRETAEQVPLRVEIIVEDQCHCLRQIGKPMDYKGGFSDSGSR
jgi:hypothetical protein